MEFYTTEDMINNWQSLKGKTKLKFHQSISDYYNQMIYFRQSNTFQFQEYPFSEGA